MLPSTKTLIEWEQQLVSRHSQEIKLGLSRIRHVAQQLKLLNPKAKVVTIAGTNGKGSTVALLESIYCQAGFNVASYTSPHLLKINERIQVNQQPISDILFVKAIETVELARKAIDLTFFEILTLAALWYFSQVNVDVIIMEVGLGGRLDATNIIDSDLAIITTINYDHQDFLGSTLDEIGFEKAGIIRANKPVIYADNVIPQSIVTHVKDQAAYLYQLGKDYSYQTNNNSFQHRDYKLTVASSNFHHNAIAGAIMATLCLDDQLPISDQHRLNGIIQAKINGRLQLIKATIDGSERMLLLDVAHNPQSAHRLASYVAELSLITKPQVIFAALSNKDIANIVSPLKTLIAHWHLILLTHNRASTLQQLVTACKKNDINNLSCYTSPLLALKAACQHSTTQDLIIVYGSFLTVSAILTELDNFKNS